jgi:hypothetical protein
LDLTELSPGQFDNFYYTTVLLVVKEGILRYNEGKNFVEFFCRSRKTKSNHFFAGSASEKILLSLQVCGSLWETCAQSGCNPLTSGKAASLFRSLYTKDRVNQC